MEVLRRVTTDNILIPSVRPGRPLALSEPEPTQPFGIPLSEPTYLHRPYLYVNVLICLKKKVGIFLNMLSQFS